MRPVRPWLFELTRREKRQVHVVLLLVRHQAPGGGDAHQKCLPSLKHTYVCHCHQGRHLGRTWAAPLRLSPMVLMLQHRHQGYPSCCPSLCQCQCQTPAACAHSPQLWLPLLRVSWVLEGGQAGEPKAGSLGCHPAAAAAAAAGDGIVADADIGEATAVPERVPIASGLLGQHLLRSGGRPRQAAAERQ
eukprot:scaffold75895_cov15-Tisochrysis_lutea.AAC.1